MCHEAYTVDRLQLLQYIRKDDHNLLLLCSKLTSESESNHCQSISSTVHSFQEHIISRFPFFCSIKHLLSHQTPFNIGFVVVLQVCSQDFIINCISCKLCDCLLHFQCSVSLLLPLTTTRQNYFFP